MLLWKGNTSSSLDEVSFSSSSQSERPLGGEAWGHAWLGATEDPDPELTFRYLTQQDIQPSMEGWGVDGVMGVQQAGVSGERPSFSTARL